MPKNKKEFGLSQKMRPIGYDYWNWSKKLEIEKRNAGRNKKNRVYINEIRPFGYVA